MECRSRLFLVAASVAVLSCLLCVDAQACPNGNYCYYVPPGMPQPPGYSNGWDVILGSPAGTISGRYSIHGGSPVAFSVSSSSGFLRIWLGLSVTVSNYGVLEKRGMFIVATSPFLLVEHRLVSGPWQSSATIKSHIVALGTTFYPGGYSLNVAGTSETGHDVVSVYAPKAGTVVTFSATSAIWAGTSAATFSITLSQEGQTYMARTKPGVDVEGASVSANQPIAVQSGGRGWGEYCGDDGMDMVLPLDKISNLYVVTDYPSVTAYEFAEVIAPYAGTQVYINGALVTTLGQRGVYKFTTGKLSVVKTSLPAYVYQFSGYYGCEIDSVLVPPLVFGQKTDPTTVRMNIDGQNGYVSILIESNRASSLRLNGNPVGTCTAVSNLPVGLPSVCNVQLTVAGGNHIITGTGDFQVGMVSTQSGTGMFGYYSLFRSAGCGDGVKTADEGCDDGNVVDGDGCSSLCQIEPAAPYTCSADAQCVPGSVCRSSYCTIPCTRTSDCGSSGYICASDGQCTESCLPGTDWTKFPPAVIATSATPGFYSLDSSHSPLVTVRTNSRVKVVYGPAGSVASGMCLNIQNANSNCAFKLHNVYNVSQGPIVSSVLEFIHNVSVGDSFTGMAAHKYNISSYGSAYFVDASNRTISLIIPSCFSTLNFSGLSYDGNRPFLNVSTFLSRRNMYNLFHRVRLTVQVSETALLPRPESLSTILLETLWNDLPVSMPAYLFISPNKLAFASEVSVDVQATNITIVNVTVPSGAIVDRHGNSMLNASFLPRPVVSKVVINGSVPTEIRATRLTEYPAEFSPWISGDLVEILLESDNVFLLTDMQMTNSSCVLTANPMDVSFVPLNLTYFSGNGTTVLTYRFLIGHAFTYPQTDFLWISAKWSYNTEVCGAVSVQYPNGDVVTVDLASELFILESLAQDVPYQRVHGVADAFVVSDIVLEPVPPARLNESSISHWNFTLLFNSSVVSYHAGSGVLLVPKPQGRSLLRLQDVYTDISRTVAMNYSSGNGTLSLSFLFSVVDYVVDTDVDVIFNVLDAVTTAFSVRASQQDATDYPVTFRPWPASSIAEMSSKQGRTFQYPVYGLDDFKVLTIPIRRQPPQLLLQAGALTVNTIPRNGADVRKLEYRLSFTEAVFLTPKPGNISVKVVVTKVRLASVTYTCILEYQSGTASTELIFVEVGANSSSSCAPSAGSFQAYVNSSSVLSWIRNQTILDYDGNAFSSKMISPSSVEAWCTETVIPMVDLGTLQSLRTNLSRNDSGIIFEAGRTLRLAIPLNAPGDLLRINLSSVGYSWTTAAFCGSIVCQGLILGGDTCFFRNFSFASAERMILMATGLVTEKVSVDSDVCSDSAWVQVTAQTSATAQLSNEQGETFKPPFYGTVELTAGNRVPLSLRCSPLKDWSSYELLVNGTTVRGGFFSARSNQSIILLHLNRPSLINFPSAQSTMCLDIVDWPVPSERPCVYNLLRDALPRNNMTLVFGRQGIPEQVLTNLSVSPYTVALMNGVTFQYRSGVAPSTSLIIPDCFDSLDMTAVLFDSRLPFLNLSTVHSRSLRAMLSVPERIRIAVNSTKPIAFVNGSHVLSFIMHVSVLDHGKAFERSLAFEEFIPPVTFIFGDVYLNRNDPEGVVYVNNVSISSNMTAIDKYGYPLQGMYANPRAVPHGSQFLTLNDSAVPRLVRAAVEQCQCSYTPWIKNETILIALQFSERIQSYPGLDAVLQGYLPTLNVYLNFTLDPSTDGASRLVYRFVVADNTGLPQITAVDTAEFVWRFPSGGIGSSPMGIPVNTTEVSQLLNDRSAVNSTRLGMLPCIIEASGILTVCTDVTVSPTVISGSVLNVTFSFAQPIVLSPRNVSKPATQSSCSLCIHSVIGNNLTVPARNISLAYLSGNGTRSLTFLLTDDVHWLDDIFVTLKFSIFQLFLQAYEGVFVTFRPALHSVHFRETPYPGLNVINFTNVPIFGKRPRILQAQLHNLQHSPLITPAPWQLNFTITFDRKMIAENASFVLSRPHIWINRTVERAASNRTFLGWACALKLHLQNHSSTAHSSRWLFTTSPADNCTIPLGSFNSTVDAESVLAFFSNADLRDERYNRVDLDNPQTRVCILSSSPLSVEFAPFFRHNTSFIADIPSWAMTAGNNITIITELGVPAYIPPASNMCGSLQCSNRTLAMDNCLLNRFTLSNYAQDGSRTLWASGRINESHEEWASMYCNSSVILTIRGTSASGLTDEQGRDFPITALSASLLPSNIRRPSVRLDFAVLSARLIHTANQPSLVDINYEVTFHEAVWTRQQLWHLGHLQGPAITLNVTIPRASRNSSVAQCALIPSRNLTGDRESLPAGYRSIRFVPRDSVCRSLLSGLVNYTIVHSTALEFFRAVEVHNVFFGRINSSSASVLHALAASTSITIPPNVSSSTRATFYGSGVVLKAGHRIVITIPLSVPAEYNATAGILCGQLHCDGIMLDAAGCSLHDFELSASRTELIAQGTTTVQLEQKASLHCRNKDLGIVIASTSAFVLTSEQGTPFVFPLVASMAVEPDQLVPLPPSARSSDKEDTKNEPEIVVVLCAIALVATAAFFWWTIWQKKKQSRGLTNNKLSQSEPATDTEVGGLTAAPFDSVVMAESNDDIVTADPFPLLPVFVDGQACRDRQNGHWSNDDGSHRSVVHNSGSASTSLVVLGQPSSRWKAEVWGIAPPCLLRSDLFAGFAAKPRVRMLFAGNGDLRNFLSTVLSLESVLTAGTCMPHGNTLGGKSLHMTVTEPSLSALLQHAITIRMLLSETLCSSAVLASAYHEIYFCTSLSLQTADLVLQCLESLYRQHIPPVSNSSENWGALHFPDPVTRRALSHLAQSFTSRIRNGLSSDVATGFRFSTSPQDSLDEYGQILQQQIREQRETNEWTELPPLATMETIVRRLSHQKSVGQMLYDQMCLTSSTCANPFMFDVLNRHHRPPLFSACMHIADPIGYYQSCIEAVRRTVGVRTITASLAQYNPEQEDPLDNLLTVCCESSSTDNVDFAVFGQWPSEAVQGFTKVSESGIALAEKSANASLTAGPTEGKASRVATCTMVDNVCKDMLSNKMYDAMQRK